MSIIPWSFSKMNDYETCPRRFYEVKVLKNYVEEKSEQIIWGEQVHLALENNVKDGTPLPENMRQFNYVAAMVAKAQGEKYPEISLAVNAELEPTAFDADDAWARGYCDIAIINGYKATALDYKTGKKKPQSPQLTLMSLLIFARFPEVEVVHSGFVWLQFKSTTPATYHRDEIPELWKPFYKTLRDMEWSEKNNIWPAKPSGLCEKWCPVKTCAHNGRRNGGRR